MNLLKDHAEACGYNGELCTFLDVLEQNGQLEGVGLSTVASALKSQLPKFTIVKIALANRWRLFSSVYTERMLEKGIKPDYEYTLDDWAEKGEEEFKKHCDKAGHFRFDDFKKNESEPLDMQKINELREKIRACSK